MIKKFGQFFKRRKDIRKSITPEGYVDDSIEDYFNDFADQFDLDLRIYKRKGGDPSGIDDRCFIVMDRKGKILENDISKMPTMIRNLKDVLKRLEVNNFLVMDEKIVPTDMESTISFNALKRIRMPHGGEELRTVSFPLKNINSFQKEFSKYYSDCSSVSDFAIIIYLF